MTDDYLSEHDQLSSVQTRRQKLLSSKGFVCGCPRCVGDGGDDTRRFACVGDSKSILGKSDSLELRRENSVDFARHGSCGGVKVQGQRHDVISRFVGPGSEARNHSSRQFRKGDNQCDGVHLVISQGVKEGLAPCSSCGTPADDEYARLCLGEEERIKGVLSMADRMVDDIVEGRVENGRAVRDLLQASAVSVSCSICMFAGALIPILLHQPKRKSFLRCLCLCSELRLSLFFFVPSTLSLPSPPNIARFLLFLSVAIVVVILNGTRC